MTDEKRKILVVDDTPHNVKLLADVLSARGYSVVTAANGKEALEHVENEDLDLVLLDVVMPGMNGYEVCRQIRENPRTQLLPVVLVTALDPGEERIKGIRAGADDFLTKPIDQQELRARVQSLLRIRELHEEVGQQARQLESQAAELADWNATLEQRVEEQMAELQQMGQLQRFVSPQVARLIVGEEGKSLLETHRREITVVFLDLRGFTAFAESSEPEEVMGVLREYQGEMGRLIMEYEGTLEHFAGDGMMIFFNDPVEIPDAEERALRMVLSMRDRVTELRRGWDKRGYELGHGVGIDTGYATLGVIGFERRWDYAAIGTVTNIAARLCSEARDDQIVVSRRFLSRVEGLIETESIGELTLKGIRRPIPAYNVVRLAR